VALTTLAVQLYDAWLQPLGVGLASPREAERRGGHVTLTSPRARELTAELIEGGVIPDFRRPDGIRLGLAPLTTRYVDVYDAMERLTALVRRDGGGVDSPLDR
jgi:kynureninase